MPRPPAPPPDAHARIRELERQVERLARTRTVLPYVDADPTTPTDGMAWIRSDTDELCYVSGGTVRHVAGF